jgi:hypothetical protein
MDINYPCSEERMDYVLPMKAQDKVYIAVRDGGDDVLSVEANNTFTYVFVGDSPEDLTETVSKFLPDSNDWTATPISVYELLDNWRSVMYKEEPTLLIGCDNRFATTSLLVANGHVYPHVYQLLTYLTDLEGVPYKHNNALVCSSTPQKLQALMYALNNDVLNEFFSGNYKMTTETLLEIGRKNPIVYCDGSLSHVGQSLGVSLHYRKMRDNNV